VSYCRWMGRYDTKVITTRTGNTGSSEESGENWDKELWDMGGEGRVDEIRLFWALLLHPIVGKGWGGLCTRRTNAMYDFSNQGYLRCTCARILGSGAEATR
jgi:hypothetical protein